MGAPHRRRVSRHGGGKAAKGIPGQALDQEGSRAATCRTDRWTQALPGLRAEAEGGCGGRGARIVAKMHMSRGGAVRGHSAGWGGVRNELQMPPLLGGRRKPGSQTARSEPRPGLQGGALSWGHRQAQVEQKRPLQLRQAPRGSWGSPSRGDWQAGPWLPLGAVGKESPGKMRCWCEDRALSG